MRIRAVAAAVLIGLAITPAPAAPPADVQPAESERRFAMHPVEGGFVRLDTTTGAVSLCTRRGSGFTCEAVPDERGQQQEIERLKAENKTLVEENRRLVDESFRNTGKKRFELPSEADVDKGLDYLERMFRKFRDRIRDLDKGSRGTPL